MHFNLEVPAQQKGLLNAEYRPLPKKNYHGIWYTEYKVRQFTVKTDVNSLYLPSGLSVKRRKNVTSV